MARFNLLVNVIIPILASLQVYGIMIAARLRKTGWDIKGLLMVLSLALPGIGWLIALIVSNIRNKRLKKAEASVQNPSDDNSPGYLFHHRLFLFMQHVTMLMVCFLIGKAATWLYFYFTFAHFASVLVDYDRNYLENSLINQVETDRKHKDSTIQKRRDSVTHRIIDSIIQTRIDSLRMLRDNIVK